MSFPNGVLFKGLGGAGQRHLRLFRKKFPETQFFAFPPTKNVPLLKENFEVNSDNSVANHYNVSFLDSFEAALEQEVDLCVIATPSIMHEQDIVSALSCGMNVFCEKPAITSTTMCERITRLTEEKKLHLFVSFQRMHHPLVEKLKAALNANEIGKIVHVNVEVSSYLPAWHPYEDYRELYASKKSLGGGVVKTECHELYLLCDLFGTPKAIEVIKYQNADADIEAEDTALVTMRFGQISVTLKISFFNKSPCRKLTVFGENGFVELDIQNSEMTSFKNGKSPCVEQLQVGQEELFQYQLEHYLSDPKNASQLYMQNATQLAKIFDIL